MTTAQSDWRQLTRRQIAWLLLIKLGALIALWALFFSPQHRVHVTPDAVLEQFSPAPPATPHSGE